MTQLPTDDVEPDQHPEVPSPDTGRETTMPNRHAGESAERPGHHDDAGTPTTPDPPAAEPDPDPDPITPPEPVANPDPEDPSVST